MRRALELLRLPATPLPLVDYGRRGSPIPGSRLYRDYCRLCDEPIAISPSDHLGMQCCAACAPRAAKAKPRHNRPYVPKLDDDEEDDEIAAAIVAANAAKAAGRESEVA